MINVKFSLQSCLGSVYIGVPLFPFQRRDCVRILNLQRYDALYHSDSCEQIQSSQFLVRSGYLSQQDLDT